MRALETGQWSPSEEFRYASSGALGAWRLGAWRDKKVGTCQLKWRPCERESVRRLICVNQLILARIEKSGI